MSGERPTVTKYEKGTNLLLDTANAENEDIYIVQGRVGRYPVIAGTEEQARQRYEEPIAEREHLYVSTLSKD